MAEFRVFSRLHLQPFARKENTNKQRRKHRQKRKEFSQNKARRSSSSFSPVAKKLAVTTSKLVRGRVCAALPARGVPILLLVAVVGLSLRSAITIFNCSTTRRFFLRELSRNVRAARRCCWCMLLYFSLGVVLSGCRGSVVEKCWSVWRHRAKHHQGFVHLSACYDVPSRGPKWCVMWASARTAGVTKKWSL